MSVTIRLDCDGHTQHGPCSAQFLYSSTAMRIGQRWEELSIERLREVAELSAGWSTETITEQSLGGPAHTITSDFCKEHTHHD